MIDQLKAIEAALVSLGYPTHRIYATKPTAQYLVLGSRAYGDSLEEPLSDPVSDVATDLRVTAVAGTPDGVATMLRRVRGILSPDRTWHSIPMGGWQLETKFIRSEFIDVDTSTTNTSSGLHPAFGVDTYSFVTQPI